MKKRILYTLLAVICCLSLLFTLASCGGETETTTAAGDEGAAPGGNNSYTRVNAAGKETANGKYILFGSYPQSVVSDSALQSTLENLAGTLPTSDDAQSWISYGYYVDGSVSDYMWYQDVKHNGDRYRAVYFTSYRPSITTDSDSSRSCYQDDNGYTTGTVYFFKYEPIKWRILEEQDGKALLLCEMVIDCQEYYHDRYSDRTIDGTTVYPNNYEYSNIRAWLNDNFYNTAFNDLQKQLIQLTTVDNSPASTAAGASFDDPATSYACKNTDDKVFLLSTKEVTTNKYGFAPDPYVCETARQKQTTDYTKCQGDSSSYSNEGYNDWWLRSPSYSSSSSGCARFASKDGDASFHHLVVNSLIGVCPALWISL